MLSIFAILIVLAVLFGLGLLALVVGFFIWRSARG